MSKPTGTGGYILLSVLVAIVVITLLASAVATVSERAVDQAQTETDAFQAQLDAISTRDSVFFLLATQRQTVAGLTVDDQVNLSWGHARYTMEMDDILSTPPPIPIGNEIALDGTAYRGIANTRFALQDDSGRFSINWTPDPLRDRFLDALGVPRGNRRALDQTRLDFQDPDTFHRPEGAEVDAYRELGLPPPPNRPLRTPLELRQMKGWRDPIQSLSDVELVSLITATGSVALNPNTAVRMALDMFPGMDATTAERIKAQRVRHPFLLHWEFLGVLGEEIDEDSVAVTLLPSGAGTLKLWNNGVGATSLLHWTLTPSDDTGRPWRINYQITLPRDDETPPTPTRAPATPLFSAPNPARG